MSAKQILTKPPPADNQSRPKLGPVTHLTRTRALPRRHLQGGARHETRRCRPILAGFWAFTREGNEGGEGRTSAAPPGRKNGAKGVAAAGPDKPTKRFPIVPSLTTEHTSSPDPAHETQAAGDDGAEGVKEEGAKPQIRRGGENSAPQPAPAGGSPPAWSSNPARITRSRRQPRGRRCLAKQGRRPRSEDLRHGRSVRGLAATFPGVRGNIRARPSGGGGGERGKGGGGAGETLVAPEAPSGGRREGPCMQLAVALGIPPMELRERAR